TSSRAWKSPYHLCTPDISIAGRVAGAALVSASGMPPPGCAIFSPSDAGSRRFCRAEPAAHEQQLAASDPRTPNPAQARALGETHVARVRTGDDVDATHAGVCGVVGESVDETAPDAAITEARVEVHVQVRGIVGNKGCERRDIGSCRIVGLVVHAADEGAGNAAVACDGEIGPLRCVLEIASEPTLAECLALGPAGKLLGVARVIKDGVDPGDQPLAARKLAPAPNGNLAHIMSGHRGST